jgi:hypothetical protein
MRLCAAIIRRLSRRDSASICSAINAPIVTPRAALIDRSEIYALEDWWKRIEAPIAQAETHPPAATISAWRA